MSEPVAIQSTPEGYTARVNSDGQIATESEVTNPVDTQPATGTVTRTSVTVQNTSGQLVAALANRRGIYFQSQGAFPIYIRFGTTAATAADWLVPPGGELRLERFPCEDAVQAIAPGGNTVMLVLQMAS